MNNNIQKITTRYPSSDSYSRRLSSQQVEFIYVLSREYTICAACKAVGISRSDYLRWYKESPTFHEKIEDYKETLLDNAEKNLYRIAESGNFCAIRYILECHGKSRGWGLTNDDPDAINAPIITLAEGRLLGYVNELNERKRLQSKSQTDRRHKKHKKHKRKSKTQDIENDNNIEEIDQNKIDNTNFPLMPNVDEDNDESEQ